MTLARVLEMPRATINEALLAAGFAPEYSALPLNSDGLAPAMEAIDMILENHSPMPAIVIDAAWNIVGGNAASMKMMTFLPMAGSPCIVDAIINDDADNPMILNWSVVATWTLLRLQAEVSRQGRNSPVYETYQRLANDPRLKHADTRSFSEFGPVLTTKIRVESKVLNLLTMLAEFSTVQDVTMSERRVELFFPADEETRLFFESLS